MLPPRRFGPHSRCALRFQPQQWQGQGRCSLPDAPMNTSTVRPPLGNFVRHASPAQAACPLLCCRPFERPACFLSTTCAPARRLNTVPVACICPPLSGMYSSCSLAKHMHWPLPRPNILRSPLSFALLLHLPCSAPAFCACSSALLCRCRLRASQYQSTFNSRLPLCKHHCSALIMSNCSSSQSGHSGSNAAACSTGRCVQRGHLLSHCVLGGSRSSVSLPGSVCVMLTASLCYKLRGTETSARRGGLTT